MFTSRIRPPSALHWKRRCSRWLFNLCSGALRYVQRLTEGVPDHSVFAAIHTFAVRETLLLSFVCRQGDANMSALYTDEYRRLVLEKPERWSIDLSSPPTPKFFFVKPRFSFTPLAKGSLFEEEVVKLASPFQVQFTAGQYHFSCCIVFCRPSDYNLEIQFSSDDFFFAARYHSGNCDRNFCNVSLQINDR